MPRTDLADTLKELAERTIKTGMPARCVFGTVESANPLKIRISSNIVLTSDFLVLSQMVVDHKTEICINGGERQPCILYDGLQSKEKVVLLQQPGGQKFIVLDRVGVPCSDNSGSNLPGTGTIPAGGSIGYSKNVSTKVVAYKGQMEAIAKKYGMTAYVGLLMAVMMQESGGSGNDPMQASEGEFNTRYDKAPNSITDPVYSIECGVQELQKALQTAKVKGPGDLSGISLALQIYNYGSGFYLGRADGRWNGCKAWSQSAANSYHNATGEGDPQYVNHVLRYYGVSSDSSGSNWAKIKKVADAQLGVPYVFGGNMPGKALDCSSFVCYVFTQAGIKNMPRTTAQGIYDRYCTHINSSQAQAGDIIFFQGTYDAGETITHVGIYAGHNDMIAEGGANVHYTSLNTAYWKEHFYAYGRPK